MVCSFPRRSEAAGSVWNYAVFLHLLPFAHEEIKLVIRRGSVQPNQTEAPAFKRTFRDIRIRGDPCICVYLRGDVGQCVERHFVSSILISNART